MPANVARILARADVQLRTQGDAWRTLEPGRDRASSFVTIGERVLPPGADAQAAATWAEALVGVAMAMRASFPENIFWDLDLLGRSLWETGELQAGGVAREAISQHGALLVAVQEVFGRSTTIAFRYVHDFVYGFDWAKWVARDPAARSSVAPFSPLFSQAMLERGRELHALIAERADPKYPPLPGDQPRNPFGFSREPEAETLLLRHLAAADLLPVQAWRVDAARRWDRPFARLRREAAQSLGLALGLG